MRFETLAVHAAAAPDPTTGAVAPPIQLSTTFERAPDGTFPGGFNYIRPGNPTRVALETALGALEGGEAAAFASGMAATMTVFQALDPGDRVIAPLDAYYGTPKILRELFTRWGLRPVFADLSDLSALDQALREPARLVWLETPSNPLIAISDIREVVARSHARGALVACDNTWATPMLQRPLELGADLVMHSTTKYLSGHSDVMGGAIVTPTGSPLRERIKAIQADGGAIPSPFDSWLTLRGIRTLPARMRVHCENARRVAAFLAAHPGVERVHFPGLVDDPGHAVAAGQMRDFGGMLSAVLPGGRERAFAVAARLRLFTRATSLGGPESLVEHRASVEGPATRTPEGLLRFSIGLEHPDDLIEDLTQALAT